MSAKSVQFAESGPKNPEIIGITRSQEHVELKLVIPDALFYFRGHFPGFALLPGVVQLHWAVQYGMQHFALGEVFPSTIRVKFRKPIRPSHRLTLSLKYVHSRSRIHFDYADAEGACSSGQIGFAPK
jgi:3-hydroxymyristoyl/3-hydroxydecanoyl-(acyl carrier protein) dehydratase